jgi:putative exosortase-associated protein (TIGR04073 family)
MKFFICSLILLACFNMVQADIQDPPIAKYSAFRKFSRGVGNVAYGVAEVPHTIAVVNDDEGNSAAASFGVLSGIRRSLQRMGHGVYEIATHPFPRNRGTYKPYLKSRTRGNHGTFTEFPPELGFESNRNYTRY